MKRDRNTFFSNYNAQTQSYFPTPNNSMYGPYTESSMNQSYYQGPNLATNNEIENRLSKIERQINRLDNRLSKLENLHTGTTTEELNYNNMYML